MYQRLYSGFALAGLLSIGGLATLEAPKITQVEAKSTLTHHRRYVTAITIGIGGQRRIWLTGPWLDYASSVSERGNVFGKIEAKKDLLGKGQVEILLTARSSAVRGLKYPSLNIACPVVPFDCNGGPLPFQVRVFETGPVSSITVKGAILPNSRITVTLGGAGMDVAAINTHWTSLVNPVIVGRTNNTISIQGTTKSCGNLVVSLKDRDDAEGEYAYRGVSIAGPLVGAEVC